MPAKSKKQQQAMAIAEHEPKKLYKRNKGLKKMSQEQLHDFASTPTKKLPNKVKVKNKRK
jgi:DNA gyrase/topoisomerase IV subunit B